MRLLRGQALIVVFSSVTANVLGFCAQTQKAPVSAGEIYKSASPSVVLIEMYDEKGEVSKTGSGFIVSATGAILTNYHVIAHSKRATVRLANQDAYDTVDVLDFDKRKDIALIKIKAIDLPYLRLGRSSQVEVGDKVYSLSNPLGLFQNSLSEGIVSGIRQGDGYRYFQMSAPISHGSSGGPIFNANGEVIGIAVATLEEGQNLNFAVPIDYAAGMLTSSQPRSLASIYEPEPPKSQAEPPKNPSPPPSPPGTAVSSAVPNPSDEMKKSNMAYLETKLRTWTAEDAKKELGEPVRSRPAYAGKVVDGIVYAYPDPTHLLRELELNFDGRTKTLRAIYGYPWSMTWEQCKQIWGDDARIQKNADGSKFHMYRHRNLMVLVDKSDHVVSIGIYIN